MATFSEDHYEVITATFENQGLQWIFENAKREGWEPGISDLSMYSQVDPNGFFVGVLNGQIIGCLSGVRFDDSYGFIGYYIVDPEHRGKGYGYKLWQHAIGYLGDRNMSLDGLLVQVPNYQKSGFNTVHHHIRFKGSWSAAPSDLHADKLKSLSDIPFPTLVTFDRKYFPAARDTWLTSFLDLPGAYSVAYVDNGELLGYGIMRPCVSGYRLAPLYASTVDVARQVILHLASQIPQDAIFFIDVPSVNESALQLLREDLKLEYQWECAKMYTLGSPAIDWSGVYGVSSLELG
jgi:GNAT superfamily N-acetyltransferase